VGSAAPHLVLQQLDPRIMSLGTAISSLERGTEAEEYITIPAYEAEPRTGQPWFADQAALAAHVGSVSLYYAPQKFNKTLLCCAGAHAGL
jgi:hypothetical protein